MFKVTIEEIIGSEESQTVKRYEQTVDVIDLRRVMDAVNAKPRKPRERKPKNGG